MSQTRHLRLSAFVSAFLLAVPMAATLKSGADVHQSAAAPAKAARSAWPPETLDGTIMSIDASRHLMIVNGPDKVPFDIRVDRHTRIMSGDQRLQLSGLASAANQHVSVRFTPERSGDVAQLIRIEK